jgi:hypothetical protein
LRAFDVLNSPAGDVTISAIAGMTGCNRTGLRGNTNQSPQDAMQLAAEKEFCAWRLPAYATAIGRKSQSLYDLFRTPRAQAPDMSGISRETGNRAISNICVVELRGFEPLTSAGVGARAIDGAAASGSPFSDSCGFSDKKKSESRGPRLSRNGRLSRFRPAGMRKHRSFEDAWRTGQAHP